MFNLLKKEIKKELINPLKATLKHFPSSVRE